MKNKLSNQDLNQLIADLLRCYSDSIRQQNDTTSAAYFMTRVRARIRSQQPPPSFFWETGIIKAQKWLVAFSLIAIIFFVGNLVFTYNPPLTPSDSVLDSLALTDHDWDHVGDDTIETSKQ